MSQDNPTRTIRSVRNIAAGLIMQGISILMGFATRWAFVRVLGSEYLGISGLFTNVLTLLSLTELGFGSAMLLTLYKPVAEKDTDRISAYMQLYKKIYAVIGTAVFVIGLALIPLLPLIIREEVSISESIQLLYVIFLIKSASSYFFVYKSMLLNADQNEYVISLNHTIFLVINNAAQIIALFTLKVYLPVLILSVAIGIAENISISIIADRKYPYIKPGKNPVKLSAQDKKTLASDVKSMFLYRFSGTIINGTDNILITYFAGLVNTGIYSNYLFIVDVIRTFLSYIFNSLTASIADFINKSKEDKSEDMFRLVFFTSSWLYGFCSVCLFFLLNPFIKLVFGSEYLFGVWSVAIIVLNFYTAGLQYAATTYRGVKGLFKVKKYRPILAAVINLGSSILLAPYYGVSGIIAGTIISRLLVYFWYDPKIIYNMTFNKSSKSYFVNYIKHFLVTLVSAVCVWGISLLCASLGELLSFAIVFASCLIIPNFLFFVVFHKSPELEKLKIYVGFIRNSLLKRK